MQQEEKMTSESVGSRRKAIEKFIASLGDQFNAEMDAKVNDPNYLPEPIEWLDDPDPMGMNWTWLFPDRDNDS